MKLFIFLLSLIKSEIEFLDIGKRLKCLFGRKKGSYVKVELPKKYLPMIESLAKYGVVNNSQLIEILENHIKKN